MRDVRRLACSKSRRVPADSVDSRFGPCREGGGRPPMASELTDSSHIEIRSTISRATIFCRPSYKPVVRRLA